MDNPMTPARLIAWALLLLFATAAMVNGGVAGVVVAGMLAALALLLAPPLP